MSTVSKTSGFTVLIHSSFRKHRIPRVPACGVPWFSASRCWGNEWDGPQHRGPHLSWEKALGAGCRPSFPVVPHPGNDPHAAFGKLHRRPVHRPPLGPLQHLLTQPSRTLQGTSVHPVQRRGHQTALHVSLRGNIHTNTDESAERRTPLHFGVGPRASTSLATTAPGSAQGALQPAPCQGLRRALSLPPFPWPPPLASEPSPLRPLKAHAPRAHSAREDWFWNTLRRRSRPLAGWRWGAWPCGGVCSLRPTRLLATDLQPLRGGCPVNCLNAGAGSGGGRGGGTGGGSCLSTLLQEPLGQDLALRNCLHRLTRGEC